MKIFVASALLLLTTTLSAAVLDDFESIAAWSAQPSDGVELRITQDAGLHGKAMRLDFDFHGGAGYAIARRKVDLDLPANWEFAFWMRAQAPVNNLEFKLVDPSGDNVWWMNRRMFEYPREWQQIRTRKRQVQFAWGPIGGGDPHRIAALEIVITAGTGGKGTVWLDDLTYTERAPVSANPAEPVITQTADTMTFDFAAPREVGGIIVDWSASFARDYDVEISDDGQTWTPVYRVRGGNGGRDFVATPDVETRFMRIRMLTPGTITDAKIQPAAWSATPTDFIANVARTQKRGLYPRYLYGEQVYWTIVGVDGDEEEAIISEDGAIEPFPGGFSIEPFLLDGDKIITWADVTSTQKLEDGYLPIPSVTWRTASGATLTTTAVAAGSPGASTLYVRYHVTSQKPLKVALALRPLQVNPTWQFLGVPGGAAKVRSISYDGSTIGIDGHAVVPITKPLRFRAATFDQADITELVRGPDVRTVTDERGAASAAMVFAGKDVVIAVPFHDHNLKTQITFQEALRGTAGEWRMKLGRTSVSIPAAPEIADTLRATVAYMLINRDGPAIQPGSRAYARSWIRDGSLTSAALMRLGHAEAGREFLKWFAPYEFESGKVPCCVDRRGADPVPENDSNGELLYLAAEYYRFTHDRVFIESLWPYLDKAVRYIRTLRLSQTEGMFKGLMPESISHEGYSAKPMHSYWDDFLTLKGLKDAAYLAEELGRPVERAQYAVQADELRLSILNSLEQTTASHKIDFIPGSAELGDFDATSTSIALEPGDEMASLPQQQLRNTFDKYWRELFVPRRDGTLKWDAYTPYELRNIASFIRLGQKDRALEALDYFMHDRRPIGWREWAEVVWKDVRTPKFIGDMPHTWVGSDFIRSVTDFFAYVDRDTLVIAAGIPSRWLDKGPVKVEHLHTQFGEINVEARREEKAITVALSGNAAPPGGFTVRSPADGTEKHVQSLPATVVFR